MANVHLQPIGGVATDTLLPGTVLLISAETKSAAVASARGLAPRRDYLELERSSGAEVFDAGRVRRGLHGRLMSKLLGPRPAHGILAYLRSSNYDAVFADNELTGLVLGILLRLKRRRPRLVILAHHLTPSKKHLLVRLALPAISQLLLHSEAQRRLAVDKLKVAPSRLRVIPYQVDTQFWQPGQSRVLDQISTAGLECRDYDTLVAAIEGLPVSLFIGAASHWSRKRNPIAGKEIPPNVVIDTFDYVALRRLYAESRFIVVPLLDVDFQAGITTVLEGMSMAKALILTRNSGSTDAVLGPLWQASQAAWPEGGPTIEQSTGIYVMPSDVPALQAAMRYLLANPVTATILGENGRRRVLTKFSLEGFVDTVAAALRGGHA